MKQREIKFRAICERESVPRDVWGVDFLNLKVLVDISGSYEWRKYKKLFEFTGLYDKNEKMIFEGDTIKTKNQMFPKITVEIPDFFYSLESDMNTLNIENFEVI